MGGAIPKGTLPGLQPSATAQIVSTTDAMDILRAPFTLYAWVGSQGADTAVLGTVRPNPALAGEVSVPLPVAGYGTGYDQRINSLGGTAGSDMGNLNSRVVALLQAQVRFAVSAPSRAIGYSRRADGALPLSMCRTLWPVIRPCDFLQRAGH